MTRYRFLFAQLARHKWAYSTGILAIFATNLMTVSVPGYLKEAIDFLSNNPQGQDQTHLRHVLTMILLLALAVVGVRTLSRVMFFNPGRRVEAEVKNRLFEKLTHLEKNYHDKNEVGAIISRLQNDITGLRLLAGFGIMQFFNILSALSLTPYMMWQLSPELTLFCVLPVVLVFGLVRFGMSYMVAHMHLRQSRLQELSGFIVSSLSGVEVVKGFSLEGWTAGRFNGQNDRLIDETLKISLLRSFLMPILGNLENILKVLVLTLGGYYVIQHQFSIGELTEFIAYAALLTHPIMGLGWLTTLYQQGMVGIDSIETILKQETPRQDLKRHPQPTELFEQGLVVDNLSFAYPGGEPLLRGISFTIKPGQTLGILGKIGSGKTTLVNCLNGHLPVGAGQIRLGSEELVNLHPADLRQVIRTVSQEVFLFSDSVKNNILFGAQGDLSDQELLAIVQKSALKDEVARFPLGLDTLVGERGIMLSGGQKQRIALARALAAKTGLLILDNVLSAVDYETERFLLSQILKRDTAQSLLIVSHRVRALESADQILVLDQGQVVQQGRHANLIEQPGIYQSTWALQQEGSLAKH